jgi:LPXTG-site transpeptidase (sortase) family protein
VTNRNTSVASVLASARAGVATLFNRGKREINERVLGAADRLAALKDERPALLDQVVAQPTAKQSLLLSGTTLTLLGVMMTGFIADVALISPLRYAREQIVQMEQFRTTLANGSAPVGQMNDAGELYPVGTSVAIMNIPALDFTAVVGEGTTSRVLLSGPGHRRDTVLPGQRGASVIYGRQSLYGGPFGGLDRLRAGNTIRVTTGQDTSLYRISGVRKGDVPPKAASTAPGTLTLVSTTGFPFFPDTVIRVDASLVSTPTATPLPVIYAASLTPAEKILGSDESGWLPLLLLLELGIALIFLAMAGIRYWGRLQTWVVAVPTLLAVGIGVAEQVVVLLPNLY